MSLTERLVAYAAAFEKTFESDDFSHIEPFFTEDAVYEIAGGTPQDTVAEGRAAVFDLLQASLDGLDRRFETRALALVEGPTEEGERVRFGWKATYGKAGFPDLEIAGEEELVFRDARICRMVDTYTPEAGASFSAYMAEHGAALGIEA